ncbi:hypothetical protein EVAR_53168_1 [Eumeta japonica]|uniref:Uncharacterized protein n=1 Tax=Eumeta variegata TaxID=151549 RepID=A0A4C1YV51_EUMVA|nr:hypothetical protein EVAR_53168_1 [Eumeta japonica]
MTADPLRMDHDLTSEPSTGPVFDAMPFATKLNVELGVFMHSSISSFTKHRVCNERNAPGRRARRPRRSPAPRSAAVGCAGNLTNDRFPFPLLLAFERVP